MKFLKKWIGLLGLLFMIPVVNHAQYLSSLRFTDHISGNKQNVDSVYLVVTHFPATAIAMRVYASDSIPGSYLVARSDTFFFQVDQENNTSDTVYYSNLYTSSQVVDSFQFSPGRLNHPVEFVLIDSRLPENNTQPPSKKKSDGCSEPEMIDQAEWRQGLPEPDYVRIPNIVHNIIIHHSAGSNSDTNYIQIVRSIYIYHTVERGWSDIGYNYLVAQDGTLFKGRDPGSYEQDNVLGAHFCASNTGTMGICVLGDYMELSPPQDAIQSLKELITWKLGKDSLDPLGIYPHPLNASLNVIAGHRDGCATACPGDSLYNQLPEFRLSVMEAFDNCGYSIKPVDFNESLSDVQFIFISENELEIYHPDLPIEQTGIFDMIGRECQSIQNKMGNNRLKISINYLPAGIYILTVYSGGAVYANKIMILSH